MDWVENNFFDSMRWGHVVGYTGCRSELRRIYEKMLMRWKDRSFDTDLPDTDGLRTKLQGIEKRASERR
jgi:hypothetical protein